MRSSRAQLVLAAAAMIAIALAPVVFAYLQLGYHGDVTASRGYTAPGENAERVLSQAVTDAADGIPSRYDWSERDEAADAVRSRLSPRLETLRSARVAEGTVYQVSYNDSTAGGWAADPTNCPGGPDRQFGACRADSGVIVQERAGETHVLAVAFDLTVTTERGVTRLTVVVEVVESRRDHRENSRSVPRIGQHSTLGL